jgi:multiple sugar transport system permease protein
MASRRSRRQALLGYLFLLPFAAHFGAFVLFPFLSSVYLSFTDWNLLSMSKEIVGFQNYSEIFGDRLFYKAVANTLTYVAFDGAGVVVFGLLMGAALNTKIKGIGFYRTAFYIPVVVDWVIVSTVWMFIFDPAFGLANYGLSALGLPKQMFLQSPTQAMPIIIVSSIWKGVGYYAVFYLAALQDVPETLIEAARIDGASTTRCFWHITLPQIAPVSVFVMIMAVIGALKGFDQFYLMTQGGPARATTTIMFYFYEVAFGFMQMGKGATIAIIFTAIVLLIVLVQRTLLSRMAGASGVN